MTELAVPPFVPHPLLRNGHVMTIAGALLPRRPRAAPAPERRVFQVDSETRVLALCDWQRQRRDAPVLVLLHGLCGSADSGYLRGTSDQAVAAGFNVVRLNFRNCGGTEAWTPTLYHSGLTADLAAVVRELAEVDGFARIAVAGFSLGGNAALKYAGELGAAAPAQLLGVAAVSPPIDLAACADAIDAGALNRLYQRRFLAGLAAVIRTKAAHFPGRFDVSGLDAIRSIRGFDDRYTAPLSGFGDAVNYYRTCSAARLLDRVAVPLLIIAAADDPMIPPGPFRAAVQRRRERQQVVLTERGGHVGFVAAAALAGDRDRRWAENRVVQFARQLAAETGRWQRDPGQRRAAP